MRSRWARRLLAAAAVVILFSVAWLIFVARTYAAPIDSYQVVNDRTITVEVTGGRNVWCLITDVGETTAAVRISVECLDWLPWPGTALG